jgi:hypothetical protein
MHVLKKTGGILLFEMIDYLILRQDTGMVK